MDASGRGDGEGVSIDALHSSLFTVKPKLIQEEECKKDVGAEATPLLEENNFVTSYDPLQLKRPLNFPENYEEPEGYADVSVNSCEWNALEKNTKHLFTPVLESSDSSNATFVNGNDQRTLHDSLKDTKHGGKGEDEPVTKETVKISCREEFPTVKEIAADMTETEIAADMTETDAPDQNESSAIDSDRDQMGKSEYQNETVHETNLMEKKKTGDTDGNNATTALEASRTILHWKELGNIAFRSKNMTQALSLYTCAIDECTEAHQDLKAILFCNRAACYQSERDWNAVINDCSYSIKYDPGYFKAYVRRLAAYEALEKWHEAFQDVEKMIELDPSQRMRFSGKQLRLKKLSEDLFAKEKDEMLGKMKTFANGFLGKVGLSLDNFQMKQADNGSYNIQFVSGNQAPSQAGVPEERSAE
ncbi:tetratricopeptide repeat-containing protein [Cardiosporidium cionae]|uniref:Tetratricopeptide repeat-containing protein n=1 Tax=Cardiosporidium cionae TaxID=476202 RepID=A0ABQ7J9U7_9APIC|nr:tetratricopeptide repeat-containing protein [Cardiosporidium cionae]|eukprot:KAF8820744.1 tetratricopeptide repeat-containing protein [Cardiosporidium cionae]